MFRTRETGEMFSGRPMRLGVAVAAVCTTGVGVVAVASIATQRIDGGASVTEVAERLPSRTPPPISGPLSSPHPTIENLSIVWDVSGDSRQDAEVAVRYRRLGTDAWQPALPLRRVPAGSNEGFSWQDRHAGSIFGLQPGTTYEVEARLADADGPDDVRVIAATTRRIPTAMTGAPITAATPATLTAALSAATSGDIIELAAGSYSGFTIERSGAPAEPIVVRGRPGAIVDGEIRIFSREYVHVEDLTINGRIRFNGSDHVAIMRNTINPDADLGGHGIVTYQRSENSYIADNTITGLTQWRESSLGASGDNLGEGILVTGPGHVIEHNLVRRMRDGISLLEDDEAVDQFSIDILNNDVFESADDGVEADFCSHNCRVVDNRVTNSFIAMTSQPGLGGPTYFINNTIYNVAHIAFKLYRGSQGDVMLHNTVVKSGDAFGIYAGRGVSDLYMRNNLFIGGPGASYNGFSNGSGRVFAVADLDLASVDADYDGFGSTTGSFTGRFGSVRFNDLASFRSWTTEQHAVQVSLDVFSNAVVMPTDATVRFDPVDLSVDPTSVAATAAADLDNVGSLALGAATAPYGPR